MKLNKLLTRIGALLLCGVLLVTLVACGGKEPEAPTQNDDNAVAGTSVTVKVINVLGAPLANVQVYIYQDSTLAELVAFAQTDAEGAMTYLSEGSGEVAVLKGTAPGYKLEESYAIDSTEVIIVLEALAATNEGAVSEQKYSVGDPVADFTFTDIEGNTYVASQVLAEKKMLMLNFFYTTCGPCAAEFPFLQSAYDTYKNQGVLLAVDPYEEDDAEAIKAFRDSHELTIPMVDADTAWASRLNITAYPTTVVIDRYGFITFYHVGAVPDATMFETLFAYYGAENYIHKVAYDVSELEIIPTEPTGETTDPSATTDGSDTTDGSGTTDPTDGSGTTAPIDGNGTTAPTDGNGTTAPGVTTTNPGGSKPAISTVATAPSTQATTAVSGSKDNPIEIGGTLTFQAEVPAGKTMYYHVYRVTGTILNIKADNLTVVYEDVTYQPQNGTISFPVETDDVTIPVALAITNKGGKDATYTVNFNYPAGTLDNPIELKMGNFTTDVRKGNETGVVYEYKATKNGTVKMYVTSITKGVKCGFSLYNLNTSVMRNSDEDASGSNKTVSIDVKKGDVLQVTVSVLPDEKNEYPAATIKSNISFKETIGTTTKPTQADVTYKVTVKAGKKALSGVKLTFAVGSKTKTVKTDSKGVASAKLPAGTCTVQLTVPKGYIAEKLQYTIQSSSPSLTINLEKEETPPVDEEPGDIPTDYSVKVVDGAGKGQSGITVEFYNGDKKIASAKTDSKGIAKSTMMDGTYTVKLTGTTLKYDEKVAYVSVANPSVEILLANEQGTAKEKITCPVLNKNRAAYKVTEGATYVTLKPGERNYFLFTPDRDGVYRISATSNYAKVGYYGGTIHFIQTLNQAENVENNAFTVEVKDVGPTFVLGVDAATNMEATVLLITRVGDPGWSVSDEPWQTYEGTHTPKSYTLPAGTELVSMDITKTYKLVYNSADGYYHKDTKNGPIVYLRFGSSAPYVAFADILNNFHVAAYLYDSAGNFQKKEEYTECMTAYNACTDKDEAVYPLTKDLEYIIKQYGKHQGWWNPESPGYLFKDDEGNKLPDVNLDTAWMFALCYAK